MTSKRQVDVQVTNSIAKNSKQLSQSGILIGYLVALAVLMPAFASAQGTLNIPLKKVSLPDTTEFPHARIVSFSIQPGDTSKFPADWGTIETGTLLNNGSFEEVDIARFKADDGTRKYVVDVNANGKFTDDPVLEFKESHGHKIADVDVSVMRRNGGTEFQKLTYRITDDDTGATARIGECREGTFKVDGKDYNVRLVLTSVNTPNFSSGKGTVVLADLNRDRTFNPNWEFNADSSIRESERITFDKPFAVGDQRFQPKSVDPTGTNLVFDEIQSDTGLAIGFHAPEWAANDMQGSWQASDSLRGKIVLMFFWAPTCHYCEGVRPKLDAMVARDKGNKFRLMSFTTESDTTKLRQFLATKPYGGTIIPWDSTAWNDYNSRMLTPTYCLVDEKGVIQMYGAGASFFDFIEKKTDELLKK